MAGEGFAERCEDVCAKAKDARSGFSSENEMPEVRQDRGVGFLQRYSGCALRDGVIYNQRTSFSLLVNASSAPGAAPRTFQ